MALHRNHPLHQIGGIRLCIEEVEHRTLWRILKISIRHRPARTIPYECLQDDDPSYWTEGTSATQHSQMVTKSRITE